VVAPPNSAGAPGGGASLGATVLLGVAAVVLIAVVALGVASFAGTMRR
jgi:hypothetical protein